MTKYLVVVQDRLSHSYLGEHGTVCWKIDAKRFASIAEANAAISARGWENDTSIRLGAVTAYVCESGDIEHPAIRGEVA